MQKGQAPGYYRMMLGDFEIVALSDGTVALDVRKLLTNTTPTRVDQLLMRSFLEDPVETSVNGFLVNTGAKLILIDTGAGNLFGPTLGNLVNNLKAAVISRSRWTRSTSRTCMPTISAVSWRATNSRFRMRRCAPTSAMPISG